MGGFGIDDFCPIPAFRKQLFLLLSANADVGCKIANIVMRTPRTNGKIRRDLILSLLELSLQLE
jgi:hypothetical protein